jgi:hypothetical protein
MPKKTVGPLHWHELLDRTYLIGDLVERELLEHPAAKSIKKSDPIRQRLQQAADALADAYQMIGDFSAKRHGE